MNHVYRILLAIKHVGHGFDDMTTFSYMNNGTLLPEKVTPHQIHCLRHIMASAISSISDPRNPGYMTVCDVYSTQYIDFEVKMMDGGIHRLNTKVIDARSDGRAHRLFGSGDYYSLMIGIRTLIEALEKRQ